MSKWNDAVPNRETQHELKREALYREAAKGFNRRGFRGTSLADLAEGLGITKAALYHYVPNKDELLFRCVYNSTIASLEAVEVAKKEETTGLNRIHRVIRDYFCAVLMANPPCVTVYDEGTLDAKNAKIIYDRRKQLSLSMREFIRQGVEDGSVIDCDPKLATNIILGSMNWAPKWFRHDGELSSEEVANGIADMLTRGIAAVPST
ncbi:MAG: TetR/AcrR family transcriptional regulator [Alphaproteobacteria bacterium]|nr:TetR/AcrR family transcriptional regulator [Rhodospirillales bacterium]MCW9044698.1 TetR/AcrR family transcriptional regulator [Alphaproteobacteria bacterium]